MKKFLLIFILVFTLFLSSCKKEENKLNYSCEYGEAFTIPYGNTGKVEVKDSKGKNVDVLNNSFICKDINGYKISVTGDCNAEIKVNVVDTTAPVITSDYDFIKCEKNVLINYPTIKAVDSKDGECSITKTLYFNNQKVDATNSFTPTELGVYKLVVEAVDNTNNKSTKNIYFDCVNFNNAVSEVIASFSTPYGVNHIGNSRGFSASYSTDIKYSNENGSTKLSLNGDQLLAPSFSFSNFTKVDLSDSLGILFNVYNDLDCEILLALNWVENFMFTLSPKKWTEVYIPKSMYSSFSQSYTEMFKDKGSIHNVDGTYVSVQAMDGLGYLKGLSKGNIYFSDIQIIKPVSGTTLKNEVLRVPNEFKDYSVSTVNILYKAYKQLSGLEQDKVADEISELVVSYGEYLVENNGSTYDPNILVYCDSDMYKQQVSFTMVDVSIENETPLDEKAIKLVTNEGAWAAEIKFNFIFNPLMSAYSKVKFNVYIEDDHDMNFKLVYANEDSAHTIYIDLVEGNNNCVLNVQGKTLEGGYIYIYVQNGDSWTILEEGITFYISSFEGEI